MDDQLTSWLQLATAGLTAEQRRRVEGEIRAHHADAVAAYLVQGHQQAQAETLAMVDLGKPQDTAKAMRRVYRRPHTTLQRYTSWLASVRSAHGRSLFLALVGLFAAQHLLSLFDLQYTSDLVAPTSFALLAQHALLTLALCIPLAFDDLDLSLGVMVMMGALVARHTTGSGGFIANVTLLRPVDLQSALITATILGVAFGLLNGLLVAMVPAPTYAITLVTGAVAAVILSRYPAINNLALSTLDRQIVLTPTLALLGLTLLLMLAATVGAARLLPTAPAGGWPARLRHRPKRWLAAAGLLLPVVAFMGALNMGLVQFSNPAYSSEPLWLITVKTTAIMALFLFPLVAIVVAAFLSLTYNVLQSPGHRWLALPPAAALRHQSPTLVAGRICALGACSGLAAATGVLVCTQGIRDNTYILCTSFYVLAPLAGLILGGQHLLRGWQRPLGAVVGALFLATSNTPNASDNLAPSAVASVILAAIVAFGWRAVATPRHDPKYVPDEPTLPDHTPASHKIEAA